MKQIRSEIIIHTSAERVWGILIDFDNYQAWNSFTPRITLRSTDITIGAEFDLDCRLTDQHLLKDEHEVILALEPDNFRFCMGTSRTRGRTGIRSFRWQICESIDAGTTRFINYEEFKGPLATIVNLIYAKKLMVAFKKYCLALKEYAERN